MMSIKKRKKIQFKLEAYWIDEVIGNRRSWLFYIFCVISSSSSLLINGKDVNITVKQYFKKYRHLDDDDENVYSAIIIVKQQKINIEIGKLGHVLRSDILCFEC